ncbi:MAG: AAA family ATPase [Coleofasciculaceae cyanobacterium]
MLAFQEMNAEFFFGRETFVDGLVRVVEQQPLVAVIGSSGSGKSSVVLAGLIPKLREEGSWLIESFRPNKQPFYELAAALISQLEPELGKTDKSIKAKELAESMRQHGFTADVSAILKDKPGSRLLLVVDQFEELYTGCADTEQQQFVDALLAAAESASHAVTLVLTLRADFYSYVVNYPPFGEALNKWRMHVW